MNIFSWLDDGVCEKLMLTFAHFLWQGVAIGLLAGLLGFLMRHRSAGARYLLFTSSLLALVACPPVTYCFVNGLVSGTRGPSVLRLNTLDSKPFSRESERSANLSKMHLNLQSENLVDQMMNARTGFPNVPLEDERDSTDALFSETSSFPVPAPIETTAEAIRVQAKTGGWPTVVRFLTYCYLLGVVLLLGRFVLGMQGAARIRRSSRLLDDPDILSAITRRAKALGLRNAPPVLLCQQLLVPAVVGVMRPAILFPVAMISGLTPQQVEDVLTHELAHIRRYDHLVNVMQRVVESFLFFHPAVWFISRRIRIEREHCCDDLVIAMGSSPVDYAAALLSVVQAGSTAESRMQLSQLAILPAVGNRSELRRRIERLVNSQHQPQVYFTRKGIIMTSLTTMIVLAGSMLFSATFQADEEREDQNAAQTATQSENETEQSEKLDVSGLPEVASRNGSLTTESHSESEDAATDPTESKPAKQTNSSASSGGVSLDESREAAELSEILKNLSSETLNVGSYPLKWRRADEIVELIRNVLKIARASSVQRVAADQKTNHIWVTGKTSDLKMVEALIILLDKKPEKPNKTKPVNSPDRNPARYKLFRLHSVDATSLSNFLKHAFKDSSLLIRVEPKTNYICISGTTESNLRVIERIIEIVDTDEILNVERRQQKETAGTEPFVAPSKKTGNTSRNRLPDASPNETIHFQIRSETAEETAKVLEDVLKKVDASGDYKITVDQKGNSINVTSPSSDQKMMRAIMILLGKWQTEFKSNPTRYYSRQTTENANTPRQTRNSQSQAKPSRDATLDGRLQTKNFTGPIFGARRKKQTAETEGPSAKASSREIKIFPIKYAVAGELSKLLFDVFESFGKNGILRVAVDSRTNSIIIISKPDSNLNEIEALIRVLDQPKPEQPNLGQPPGLGSNPFVRQQSGNSSKKPTTIQPTASRKAAAGLPADLIRLTESYSNAYRELQLVKAEYDVLKVQVKQKPDLLIETRKAQVGINAAQRKLGIFKQIAEVEILSTEAELKDINEQLPKAGTPQVENGLKRQLRDQQRRAEILKKLISH